MLPPVLSATSPARDPGLLHAGITLAAKAIVTMRGSASGLRQPLAPPRPGPEPAAPAVRVSRAR